MYVGVSVHSVYTRRCVRHTACGRAHRARGQARTRMQYTWPWQVWAYLCACSGRQAGRQTGHGSSSPAAAGVGRWPCSRPTDRLPPTPRPLCPFNPPPLARCCLCRASAGTRPTSCSRARARPRAGRGSTPTSRARRAKCASTTRHARSEQRPPGRTAPPASRVVDARLPCAHLGYLT